MSRCVLSVAVHTAPVGLRFAVDEIFEHHSESKLLHERMGAGDRLPCIVYGFRSVSENPTT